MNSALAAAALGAALACMAPTPPPQVSADEVKTAYLYNFSKFVDWPASAFAKPDSPIVVGVTGDGSLGQVLENTLKGRKAGDRPFEVRRGASLGDPSACHLLVIPGATPEEASGPLAAVRGRPVLTVGDTEGFIGAGGMIRFFLEENKIRFEIAPAAAEKADLKISSKLLKVAKVVKP